MRFWLRILFILSSSALILVSCGGGQVRDARLLMLDSLVESHPDSALAVISRIDASFMSKAERMYLELLRAKAMNKADILFTTDSVLLGVTAYYDKHGTPNQQMLAHYLLGRAYSDMGSAPRAIDSYLDAVEKADTTSSDCDYGTLMRVHSQLAQVYSDLALYDNEQKECQKSYNCCLLTGDTALAHVFREREMRFLYLHKEYDRLIGSAKEIYEYYLKQRQTDKSSAVCIHLVNAYLDLHMPDSAYKYLQIFSSMSPMYMVRLQGGVCSREYLYGMYYQDVGKLDSSIVHYKNAINKSVKQLYLSDVYKRLAYCYGQRGNIDSSLVYERLYSQSVDSIYDATIVERSIDTKSLYDYDVERKKANIKALETLRLRTVLLYCVIGLVFLLLVVFGLTFRNLLASKRISELYLSHQSAIALLRKSEIELHTLSVQKQKIEKQLSVSEDKSGRLQESLNTTYFEIQKKSILVTEQMNKIRSLEDIINQGKNSDKNTLFYNSEIVDRFRRTIISKGDSIKKSDWKQLSSTVDSIFPTFRLQIDPDHKLSEIDIRVCLLVKAGFSPSDIDILLGMSHSYASINRRRLHEKVFGIPGTATEFDKKIQFIQ